MIYSKETIKSVHRLAPDNIRDIITADITTQTISFIEETYSLNYEQAKNLDSIVMLRILGILKEIDLANELVSRLGISIEKAKKVSDEIQKRIISTVPVSIFQEQERMAESEIKNVGIAPREESLQNSDNTKTVEIPPANLPMIEPGEVVHDTQSPPLPSPKGRVESVSPLSFGEGAGGEDKSPYNGQDPYREPLT